MPPSSLFPNAWGTPAFVLDVSVPLRWLVVARANQYATGVLSYMSSTTVAVPGGWPLLFAERVRQEEQTASVTPAESDHFLSGFRYFSVAVDSDGLTRTWDDVLRLARSHDLTVWDAQFLELALRLNLPLATDAPDLTAAAHALTVPIFTP